MDNVVVADGEPAKLDILLVGGSDPYFRQPPYDCQHYAIAMWMLPLVRYVNNKEFSNKKAKLIYFLKQVNESESTLLLLGAFLEKSTSHMCILYYGVQLASYSNHIYSAAKN